MKKIIWALIIILLGAGLWFVMSKEDKVTESAWQTYENKDFKFTISHPAGWTIKDTSADFGFINLSINGPIRSDLKSNPGLPVSYYFSLAMPKDRSEVRFNVGCFSTPDKPGNSPCNAPSTIEDNESAPENAVAREIFSSFKVN